MKPAETIRNQLKRLPQNCETTRNVKTGEIWNFLLAFIFQTSSPNDQIWVFWINKYQLSYYNKVLPAPYFKEDDFKSDICFKKFRAQIPKFEHFGSKIY